MIRRLTLLLASTVLALPAGAGAQVVPPPLQRPKVDQNGVDIVAQQVNYSLPLVSIGSGGKGGLDYVVYYSGNAFRTSLDSLLKHNFLENYDQVSVGNRSDVFNDPSSPTNGNGGKVVGNDYIEGDGTLTSFNELVLANSDSNYYFANFTEQPNGVRLNYYYKHLVVNGIAYTRLQSVTTNTGYQLKLNYQVNSVPPGGNGNLWTIVTSVVAINNAVEYCDPNADTCSLTGAWPQMQFASVSNIGQYTNAAGQRTDIDRNAAGSTPYFKVKTPDSSGYNIVYNMSSIDTPRGFETRVSQAIINGKQTNYSYSRPNSGTEAVTSTAPLSQTNTYYMGASNSTIPYAVTSSVDPLNRTTLYQTESYGHFTRLTPPEGKYTQLTIDNGVATAARGNVTNRTSYPKTGSSSTPLSESWQFPSTCTTATQKTCNQPTSYTDARGATTTYEYSNDHGGITRETKPADGAGLQAVKRYAYVQRYAWIKNAAGAYVQAATPVWLLSTMKTCRGGATVGDGCAVASDEIVTTYDYGPNSGPNNLLLRGQTVTSGSVNRRTCYGYDAYSNKISETAPRAGLTSCS